MKIPKKLNRAVGACDLKIELVSDFCLKDGNWAKCFKAEQIIRMDAGLPQQTLCENYWHEIIEFINATYELNLGHNKITTLGSSLAQVIGAMEEAYGKEIGG